LPLRRTDGSSYRLESSPDGVEVKPDNIFHISRIPAAERYDDRRSGSPGCIEHQPVTGQKALG
jgi:hypothetical protein